HPVQRLIALHHSLLSGVPEEDFVFGRDGCGVPTVAMPLTAMARAFARLASPNGMPAEVCSAATRVRAAMAAAPVMVSGAGSFNSELLAACDDDVIAKGGAEGLFCLASARREIGIAFKFADGSGRAQAPVALALMRAARLRVPGVLAERFERPEVRNCDDEIVGHVEPADLTLDMMA
ncbi:MAG: asparaginase, partial [Armatimonadota bacterium]